MVNLIDIFWLMRGASMFSEWVNKIDSVEGTAKTGEIDRAKAAPETVDTKAANKAGEVHMKISSEPIPGTPINGGRTIPKPPPSAGSFSSESFLAVRGFPWRCGWRTIGCMGIVGVIVLTQVLPYDGFPTFMDHSGKYPLVVHNNKQADKLNESGKALKAGDE